MTRTVMTSSARRFGKTTALIATIAIAGCITVNVNFPEQAVQKAANDFVNDLYKPATPPVAENTKAEADAEAAAVKSSVKKQGRKKTKATEKPAEATAPTTWNITVGLSEALAQELNTKTPKADQIKEQLKTLIPDIQKWKEKGVVCETSDALLVLKHPEKAAGDAAGAAKLVKQVNDLRESLYDELATVNHINDRNHKVIRKHFAQAFKEHSPAGTCFED